MKTFKALFLSLATMFFAGVFLLDVGNQNFSLATGLNLTVLTWVSPVMFILAFHRCFSIVKQYRTRDIFGLVYILLASSLPLGWILLPIADNLSLFVFIYIVEYIAMIFMDIKLLERILYYILNLPNYREM